MKSVTIRLPWPPSVNHYYGRTRRHVYLKEAGRLYRKKASLEFARLGWPRLDGPVSVRLILSPPNNRRRDIDNILKCWGDSISDQPGHKGIIADDSLIRELSAVFVDAGEGVVDATITELPNNTAQRKIS